MFSRFLLDSFELQEMVGDVFWKKINIFAGALSLLLLCIKVDMES